MKPILFSVLILFFYSCANNPNNENKSTDTAKKNQDTIVGGGCEYIDDPGLALITSTDPDPQQNSDPNSFPMVIHFIFSSDKPTKHPDYHTGTFFSDTNLIRIDDIHNYKMDSFKIGKKLKCIRRDETKGTCTPIIFDFPDLQLLPGK